MRSGGRSRGTRRVPRSTACPAAAGSTSRTRRSTGTPPARAATTSRSAGSASDGARARPHLRASSRARSNRFANVLRGARRRRGRPRLRARRPHPGALRRRARHAEGERRSLPALLGLRPGADPRAPGDRRGARAGHDRGAVPARRSPAIRAALPELEHVLLVGERRADAVPGTRDLRAAHGRGERTRFDDRADRPGGHGAAALHQRHDRHAEGRGARARRRGRAPRHRRSSRSTCTRTTSSGAPPIRAG